MNAQEWFDKSLDAASKAHAAKTAAERRRHGQNSIDALLVAASLGSHDAFLQIGIYYQHGEFGILPKRIDLAEHWLRLAAARDSGGMFALGTLLMQAGRKAEGRRWLRAALAHGEGGAACHLGREIEAKSPSRALRLYLKGAALGDPIAATYAGHLLEARRSRKALLQAEALYKKAVRKIKSASADLQRVRLKLSLGEPRSSVAVRKRRRR